MKHTKELQTLSDDELLKRLSDLLSNSRRVEADLVAHIAEVDERRLYAREAAPSMFAYCTEILHLSEHEAYERITAARASRKFPVLLEMLRDGRIHLSGLGKLAPHLTEDNCESVLEQAAYKSKRQIEELVAALAPKPDVPAMIRKLHEPKVPVAPPPLELGPDRVTDLPTVERPSARPVVAPLAPSRYKVQFTASGELRDKLERLQALLGADLDEVIDACVTEKLQKLEAKRYAETKSPRKTLAESDTSKHTRYVPAAVRRVVRERDSDQCGFVNEKGRRCTERRGLEFHHHDPFGRGGGHEPDNVSLMCRQHNQYFAERDYGKDVFERYRGGGGKVSERQSSFASN